MTFNIVRCNGYRTVKASKKDFKSMGAALTYKKYMSQKKGKLYVVDLDCRCMKDIGFNLVR